MLLAAKAANAAWLVNVAIHSCILGREAFVDGRFWALGEATGLNNYKRQTRFECGRVLSENVSSLSPAVIFDRICRICRIRIADFAEKTNHVNHVNPVKRLPLAFIVTAGQCRVTHECLRFTFHESLNSYNAPNFPFR